MLATDKPKSFNFKIYKSGTHMAEVRGVLHLPDGLHEGVPHDNLDVRPGVPLRLRPQLLVILVRQRRLRVAHVEL